MNISRKANKQSLTKQTLQQASASKAVVPHFSNQHLTIVWLREDLRLADNPALSAAAAAGPILPVYLLDQPAKSSGNSYVQNLGQASMWWLGHALQDMAQQFGASGIPFLVRQGEALTILMSLAQEYGAKAVAWNRCYDPLSVARDTVIKAELQNAGLVVSTFNGALLYEPWQIKNNEGTPYKVFTPFYKACVAAGNIAPPLPRPEKMVGPLAHTAVNCEDHMRNFITKQGFFPTKPNWAANFDDVWQVSEAAAQAKLKQFCQHAVANYGHWRNFPALEGTSRLSPYLHFGQLSPRQIWQALKKLMENANAEAGAEIYFKELIWREFSIHLLFQHPHLPEKPLNAAFANFPWQQNEKWLKLWQKGQTGYPIIDAGMRQLWQTGWMHNRVRMIVASFLVKDLFLPWQQGAAWFWDTLVDADMANNSASWQWVAGCGADAAPFHRIFNPTLQSLKFDPEGAYIRQYVPELANLGPQDIHAPAAAAPLILTNAGVVLGKNYPFPVVDHAIQRKKALNALKELKKT